MVLSGYRGPVPIETFFSSQNFISTEATVADISHRQAMTYVSYSVDEEELEGTLSYYNSMLRPGDTINIKYEISDPYNIRLASFNPIFFIFF